jgi:hypothetical protein
MSQEKTWWARPRAHNCDHWACPSRAAEGPGPLKPQQPRMSGATAGTDGGVEIVARAGENLRPLRGVSRARPDDTGPFCVDCEAKRRHFHTLCAQYLAMEDYLERGGTLEDW